MVVACLAGLGAWGASVTVSNGTTTYASELFGEGHSSPVYPTGKTPIAVLSIPQNLAARAAVDDDPGTADTDESRNACAAQDFAGEADVTFTLTGGAVFDANVTRLMWNPVATNTTAAVTAPGTVATIKDGGRKGQNFITITVQAATDGEAGDGDTARTNATRESGAAWNDVKACVPASGRGVQQISFEMPRLANVGALAGANPKAPVKGIYLNGSARVVSGGFADGPISGKAPYFIVPVIMARDSLTLGISDSNTRNIVIDGDAAFMSVKETIGAGKKGAGYVELATVTITTKQMASAGKDEVKQADVYFIRTNAAATPNATADQVVYTAAKDAVGASYHTLYDIDGDLIDEGLRGSFAVMATGSRELFNDGDMLFVDYDGNGKMGAGENIAIDGNSAMGDWLSIDPDKSDSFDKDGTGTFTVYYMPGGKAAINHGAMINLTAMVDYSDPSAIDEKDAKASSTLNFEGVGSPVRAYAIPHSTNGTGDKGNVRVRCEQPVAPATDCRVFVECWDDMGMRGFGEAPMVAGDSLTKWTSGDIESVTGLEPSSRLSCRVLSRGMVTVQQLTRDGNSGTLVNNTYVGGE